MSKTQMSESQDTPEELDGSEASKNVQMEKSVDRPIYLSNLKKWPDRQNLLYKIWNPSELELNRSCKHDNAS